MGWLQKVPVVSLLCAVAMVAVAFQLAGAPGARERLVGFEQAREEARDYVVRHPRLELDAAGERVLGTAWLAKMRATTEASDVPRVELPARLQARAQARLDELVASAHVARIAADPAWRLGVLDTRTPTRNYVAHAFVHEALAGVILSCLVLLLAGAPLERAWGSPLYAIFVFSAIPLAAGVHRLLDDASGVPWSGSAGLSAALLGAYFIRGLSGRFSIPGWVLLPAWLGLEAFVVRGFWLDDRGGVPWSTLCAAVGFGAGVAGVLRLLGVDAVLSRPVPAKGPSPVVARAARLRSDGDPYQAFDLIQAAWRDDPDDVDVREAFFDIAVEVGQPEAAADAIVPSLREALRSGDFERAVAYWSPLAARECVLPLEPTVFLRLAEGLLDAGHPDQAIFSLWRAMEAGPSSALATRIVGIARDLDADLARSAARLALADPALEPAVRAGLEPIVATAERPTPIPEAPPLSRSQLDRRVQAEHQTVELTAFPLALDTDLEPTTSDPNESALAQQTLDAGAFSAEHLRAEAGADASPGSDDVLSHWNGLTTFDVPSARTVPNARDMGEPGEGHDPSGADALAESLIGAEDLETPGMGLGLGVDELPPDLLPLEDDAETDRTPLVDATDELTSPLDAGMSVDPAPVASLRPLKALDAIPVQATSEWIELDAPGRGKSKLPLARLQAIAIAAVRDLGPRPVLVLDLVLNWQATDEPMKLLRLRSDRFDPLLFVPGAQSPLDALIEWIRWLERESQATCLPDRAILAGRFERHASLADYERDVLIGRSAG